MKSYDKNLLVRLGSLSEKELQETIIEPILLAEGFTNVRDVSGPGEKGKDLIGIKTELGRTYLYGIQLKKFRFSGKSSKSAALAGVITQLKQLIDEPAIDPTTNHKRLPDRAMFITPYAINRRALESTLNRLQELEHHNVTIIDGPNLIDLALKYLPGTILHLDADRNYRKGIEELANRIPECTAFRPGLKLFLDKLYVDISFTYGHFTLQAIANYPPSIKHSLLVNATKDEISDLIRHCRILTGQEVNVFDPPKREAIDKEKSQLKSTKTKETRLVEVDIQPVLKSVIDQVKSYLKKIETLVLKNMTERQCTNVVKQGIRLSSNVMTLQQVSIARKSGGFFERAELLDQLRSGSLCVSPEQLLKIRTNICITGPPGAGKTTLLRRLVQTMAVNAHYALPVMLPLLRLKDVSQEGLVDRCVSELLTVGYEIKKKDLLTKAKRGEVNFFFDGLDEVGSNAGLIMESIRQFSRQYPKCQVILTIRDTFTLMPWEHAFHIHIRPFDDKQLHQFIQNWFTASPSVSKKLETAIKNNPQMYETARTPVVAALLCSIYDAKREIPRTEYELYEKRFDLLLGKWDQAKEIPPLPTDDQIRCRHFLMELAFNMHCAGERVVLKEDALKFASHVFREGLEQSPYEMFGNCVYLGLLEREANKYYSFGHLTYQEYLAGCYISANNEIEFVFSNLHDPWWNKSINFYVSAHGSISPLIKLILKKGHTLDREKHGKVCQRIDELLPLAQATSGRQIKDFEKYRRGVIVPRC